MEHPESILEAARQADEAHPDDIGEAVAECERLVRQSPDFREWRNLLVRGMCQSLIWDSRHRGNRARRQARREEEYKPKVQRRAVNVLGSDLLCEVYEKYYQHRIAGRTLGNIRGDELADIASQEEAVANGHLINNRICRRLAGLVPAGRTVREAVPGPRLAAIFKEAEAA